MKKILRATAAVLFLLVAEEKRSSAQDFHLAQYDAAPLYLNPALTGMYLQQKGDYRIYTHYRSQWKVIASKPFTTAMAGYDMPFEKWEKKFGLGGFIINNRSGAGGYNTLNVLASAAYKITKKDDNKHLLSVGLQMGLLHKSFDASKLTFEMQYSSSAGDFDPTLPNGENFDKQSIFRFDGNTGIYYKYNDETKKARPFGGFSIYHVTQPNESFTSYKNRLPMHFIGNAGTDIQVNEKLMLTPKVLFMYQQKAHELNLGLNGEYDLGQSDLEILGGVYYRTSDALIAEIGIRQEHHTLRISYDFNTSYLNKFTAGRGGIEVSLILTGFKGKPLFTMSRFGGGDNPHR